MQLQSVSLWEEQQLFIMAIYLKKSVLNLLAGISPNYQLLTSKERKIFNGWIAKPGGVLVLGTDNGGFAFIGNGTADTGTGSHPRYYSNVLNENGIDNLFTAICQMEVIIGRPLENFLYIYVL
ncbi:MAG: hypothetical protein ACLVL2_15130 [Bacteroides cellulosilyticus]